MARCLIGLGANLGDKSANLAAAVDLLGSSPSVRVLSISNVHQTAPVGGPAGQDLFANAAALIETELSGRQLIELLLETEIQFGRHRDIRWQARTLDMDLLLHEHEVLATDKHIVPHPRMSFRRFVLEPCCEIAPDFNHPILDMTIAELLAAIDLDRKLVIIVSADDAVSGSLIDAVSSQAERYDRTAIFNRTEIPPSGAVSLAVAMLPCLSGKSPDCLQRDAHALLDGIKGPMLVVNSNDLESATTELLAALEAIQ